MRPLKLTMQAFANYAGKQELDFTELKNRNMFLVTGKTGAGKTTIFDAISYVLFGDTSGDFRNVSSLRSDYASGDIETYVELEFEIRGEPYKIRRRPEQFLNKKNGDGTTKTTASAEFILPKEENVVTGVTAVTKKVEEVLGVTIDQFRQIVMLPQGEFIKFLKSSSAEKEIIFRKIFGTEMFNKVQIKLTEKSKSLYSELKVETGQRDVLVRGIKSEESSVLESKLRSEALDIESILELTDERINLDIEVTNNLEIKLEENKIKVKKLEDKDRILKRDKEVIASYNESKLELDKENEKINVVDEYRAKLENGRKAALVKIKEDEFLKNNESLVTKENTLKKLKESIEMLNVELGKLKEELTIQINREPEREKLSIEVSNLSKQEEKVKDYETKKLEASELSKEVEKLKIEIEKYEKALIIEENLVIEARKYIDVATDLLVKKSEIITKGNEKKNQILKFTDLKKRFRTVEDKIIDFENEIKVFTHIELKCKKSYIEFENANDTFKKAQAGILAETLVNGEMCPVCGSKEHPKKAIKAEDVLTKEEIEKLKLEYENIVIEKDAKLSEVGILKARIESDKENILAEVKSNLGDIVSKDFYTLELDEKQKYIDVVSKKLQSERTSLVEEYKILEVKTKDYDTKKAIVESSVDKIQEIKTSVDNYKKKFDEGKIKLITISENIKGIEVEIPEEIRSVELIVEKRRVLQFSINEIINMSKLAKEKYDKSLKENNDTKQSIIITEKDIILLKELSSNYSKIFNLEIENQGFNLESYKLALEIQNLDAIDVKIKSFDERLNRLKGIFTSRELEYNKIESTDIIFIEEVLQKLNIDISELNIIDKKLLNNLTLLKGRIASNKESIEKINKINNNIKDKESTYKDIAHLASVARGEGGNSKKITFESYVLTSYFDQIIIVANQRLRKMTSGRFELRRAEEIKGNGKKGLDLNVLDNNTGKERSVSSLSGGEAFKAALSIALGLADVIQSYSGGVSIETMFIDEGFGTLDPESLDTAISCLLELQSIGRLVGVISHVQELKERIDARLEVTLRDDNRGSIAKFITD